MQFEYTYMQRVPPESLPAEPCFLVHIIIMFVQTLETFRPVTLHCVVLSDCYFCFRLTLDLGLEGLFWVSGYFQNKENKRQQEQVQQI